jgi:hypothetical protein
MSESLIRAARAASAAPDTQMIRFSRLRETRKMKLNELHYFDHPLTGLLMYVGRSGAD